MLDGFVILDKPAGMTSHDVVAVVRRQLGTRKVGHAGTLDPMATGVLVVAVGWATRLLELVVSDSKGYDAVIELGRSTDTDDRTGQTLSSRLDRIPDQKEIEKALPQFLGTIQQRPPAYSALKQGGQPLYKKARAGEVFEIPERTVEISKLELQSFVPPLLSLRVECGSGTYIRSLARDLGTVLGCGGTLSQLRRWRSGNWFVEQAQTLEQFKENPHPLLPTEVVLSWVPHQEVSDQGYSALLQGKPLPGEREPDEISPLITCGGRIIAVLEYKSGAWWPRKVRPRA